MHIMLDFETLATTPDAHVLSLGAVMVGLDLNGERFSHEKEWFFTEDQPSRRKDQGTINWWEKRDASARQVFQKCHDEGISLELFTHQFCDWVGGYYRPKVWGNGALFDIAIINHLLAQYDRTPPWRYADEMCYRTIKRFFRIEDGVIRQGTHHNALDDAKFQMECLMRWIDTRTS